MMISFIIYTGRKIIIIPPPVVKKKINLMDISIIPWEEKKFSVIIVAFVNFFFLIACLFLRHYCLFFILS